MMSNQNACSYQLHVRWWRTSESLFITAITKGIHETEHPFQGKLLGQTCNNRLNKYPRPILHRFPSLFFFIHPGWCSQETLGTHYHYLKTSCLPFGHQVYAASSAVETVHTLLCDLFCMLSHLLHSFICRDELPIGSRLQCLFWFPSWNLVIKYAGILASSHKLRNINSSFIFIINK